MPLSVQKVEGHKYKSWNESSNLASIGFNQINILFGHNGSGKSSLAGGIAKKYLAENDKSSARFFSSKYVESTLLLDNRSGIRGVVSNFGEKDVDIEKQVDSNNKKIYLLKSDEQKHTAERLRLIDDTDKKIKEIVKRRKDKNNKINNKPENKTVQEKVSLWVKDYEDAYKLFPGEDYNAITGNVDFSAESEQLNLLFIPNIPLTDGDLPAELLTILSKEYKSVDVPETEVVNWLKDGVHIHEDRKKCEFCGSSFDIEIIKSRVDKYLNDEKHKATVALDNYKEVIGQFRDVAQSIVDAKDAYTKSLGITGSDIKFNDIAVTSVKLSSVINDLIEVKIKNMETNLTIDDDALRTMLDNISNSVNILESTKRQSSQKLLDKINRLENLVKGAIGLEVKNTNSITENLIKISNCDKNLTDLVKAQKQLHDKNNNLLEQKSDLADFATFLNTILQDLNINFALLLSGKIYVLKHADGSLLKIDDISDGERNILSLIYFYYEMLGDTSGDLKDSIQLVIIDDPISSLDDNNKFYITELVRSILDQKNTQVFVFTHSWDDFCNLAYGRDSDKTSFFEVKKVSGISNLYSLSNDGKLLKPYIMLYREVDGFRQKNSADITDETVLHMPNTMRRILEEYVKFRVNLDFATASHNGDISKALFSEEFSQLSNTKKQKLNQLLAVCNILSHKANQPKNPSEIHESAKFLIGTIEHYDKYHHLKMKGD